MVETNTNNPRPFSVVALVILSILGGLVFGAGFGIIGYFIYLVILFPLLMGYLGGRAVTDSAKLTKNSNKQIILIASLLTTVVLYISFHYTRYVMLQFMTAWQAFGDLSDESLKLGAALVRYALREETGHSGFWGYMLFKANEGVAIGRIFRSSRVNLGPILTWAYWILEFAVIAFIVVKSGEQLTKKPFCEFCRSWYPESRHMGGVPGKKETEILDMIKQRDFASTAKMLEENADVPSVELYLQSCGTCNKSNSFLTTTNTYLLNGRMIFKNGIITTLTPRETMDLSVK